MQIIGLSGFARAGKDETAKVLVEQFGFKQVAFADKLREFLYALNPRVKYEGVEDKYAMREWSVRQVIDEFGWQGYKETGFSNEIRVLLQRLGTEAGRQTLWDTIWIDAAFAGESQDAKIVVSDARFYNEFDAVHKRGGEVWRIERPGVGPANDHASEIEAIDYPRFDRFINNSRDLGYLENMVRAAYFDFSAVEARKLSNVARPDPVAVGPDGLSGRPVGQGHPLAPKPGDGSITSVNVPKRRA